jgi:hypothetical protein
MSNEHVWLQQRNREQHALHAIIDRLNSPELSGSAVRGAGAIARTGPPTADGARQPPTTCAPPLLASTSTPPGAPRRRCTSSSSAAPRSRSGVAGDAGCSPDFLYNSPTLRPRIEHLRAQQQATPPPRPRSVAADGRATSNVVRALSAQLTALKKQHHHEIAGLNAALSAAHGELLQLRCELRHGLRLTSRQSSWRGFATRGG